MILYPKSVAAREKIRNHRVDQLVNCPSPLDLKQLDLTQGTLYQSYLK